MYYRIEPVFPGLTRIWDIANTAIYLAEGADKAALIDTGVGVGHLKTVVDSLTDKPVIVLLTHGHVDHAFGAKGFSDIYISPLDQEVYTRCSSFEARKGYVLSTAHQEDEADRLVNIPCTDYQEPCPFSEFKPLAPGDHFDLGDLTIEVLRGAGHTPGSLTVLIPEWQVLVLGDACNQFTLLLDQKASSVSEYREMLLKLKAETDGRYDRTLFFHGTGEGPPDIIDRVIEVCDEVLSGGGDGIDFRGPGGEPALIAKAMDFQRFCRVDGGIGNIVYNPPKVDSTIL